MKDLKKRRQRIESKEEKERTKDEEIKRQIKIFQKRAKELEYGLVKTEKGEIMAAKWNGKIIGKYTGPGLPGPTQSESPPTSSIGDLWTGWWSEQHLMMYSHYMMDFSTIANVVK